MNTADKDKEKDKPIVEDKKA
jgi:hypothetical protein